MGQLITTRSGAVATILFSNAPKMNAMTYDMWRAIPQTLASLDADPSVHAIVVAGEGGYRDAKEFMRMLMPSHAKNVKLYRDAQPIFTRYGIESQLDAMFSPTVQLRSGGYIVLNQTEALVSIDVNSGRSTREHHIEDTALKTNVEAAEEIARQLRLRDLAGLIVIDFIDMDEKRNNRTVERRMKDALRNDRARIQVSHISHFGLLEMSRQRIRTSVLESSTEKCVHCGGTGHVRSVSSVALQLLRSLEETLLKGPTHNMIVRTRPEIALYVLNHKRAHLRVLEERFHIAITINSDAEVGGLVGFTIDRGEQVMTVEQAKALLAQSESAPVLYEEEEPESDEAIDHEEEAEANEAESFGQPEQAEHTEHAEQDSDAPQPVNGDGGREGGRGRRRRRRGRGRGGEGREPGAFAQPQRAQGPFEHGEVAPDQAAGFAQPSNDVSATMPQEARLTPPYPEGGEPRANGDDNGEHRKRRRGRRGGRRNRRDRDGQNVGDIAVAPGLEGQNLEGRNPEGQDRPAQDNRPVWTEQPAPQAMTPEIPLPSFEPEQPRRRSTVREPAPSFGEGAPVAIPMPMPSPQPVPMPAPIVTAPAEADDAGKPRRTGWWAKRLLGGDKG